MSGTTASGISASGAEMLPRYQRASGIQHNDATANGA
jgi:hypothetical protein